MNNIPEETPNITPKDENRWRQIMSNMLLDEFESWRFFQYPPNAAWSDSVQAMAIIVDTAISLEKSPSIIALEMGLTVANEWDMVILTAALSFIAKSGRKYK